MPSAADFIRHAADDTLPFRYTCLRFRHYDTITDAIFRAMPPLML